ncbi:MAG: aminotransferase class I/II-fold pyridoxal phosphate-dependent enzyme [Acidimicrobiales bacterium]
MFHASYAEVRVASGAMANLYSFMACAKPGDAIIVPSALIGGHVTHHLDGAAGLYGLEIHDAPIDADGYTVDLDALRQMATELRPAMITIGGSLNLFHHPVAQVREIADTVGAKVLFDAAHLSGVIAGGAWPNPLAEGAHLMTMSTYKSLGGPPSGLLVTNDAELAERVDAIAYPGMTANFDPAKTAALAVTLVDWQVHGAAYAAEMCRSANVLAHELSIRGVPVFGRSDGKTRSHQLAVIADEFGGGQAAAKRLRLANILSSGIGLPTASGEGLRFGTPEIVRWGMTSDDMAELADLVQRGLTHSSPESVAADVTAFRQRFNSVHFIN